MLVLTQELRSALLRQDTDSLEGLLQARGELMAAVDTITARFTSEEQGLSTEQKQQLLCLLRNIIELDQENRQEMAQAFESLRHEIEGLQDTRKGVSAYSANTLQSTGVLVNEKK